MFNWYCMYCLILCLNPCLSSLYIRKQWYEVGSLCCCEFSLIVPPLFILKPWVYFTVPVELLSGVKPPHYITGSTPLKSLTVGRLTLHFRFPAPKKSTFGAASSATLAGLNNGYEKHAGQSLLIDGDNAYLMSWWPTFWAFKCPWR